VEEDKVRSLAEAKSYLERRIEELERELRSLQALLAMVNQALSRESFTRASELVEERAEKAAAPPPAPAVDMGRPVSEFSITSRSGETLAQVEVFERGAVLKPLIKLPADTPPFRNFFVARILEGFKMKDEEAVNAGELLPEDAFDYEVREEGGYVAEIRVYNHREAQRLDELRSAFRWTMHRVLEKQR